MKIAILGYGIEGKSARRFLKQKYPKARIEIRDKNLQGENYLKDLEQFDMIVRSPGIKYLSPEILSAEKRGVIVSGVTKIFFANAKGTIIGITGTKGKGTTATMLYSILKQAGKDVFLVGNIGKPMLGILPKLTKKSISIVELSSFQLQDLNISPHIAVILEIAPDHLNYHASMREYVEAKANIVANQKKNDICIYIKNNAFARSIAQKSKGKKISIDTKQDGKKFVKDIHVPGKHNLHNAAIASAIAKALKIDDRLIHKGLQSFRGLKYHMELVANKNSVNYFNDSASTNPVATVAALNAMAGSKILIAGGADKNFDYHILKNAVKNTNTRLIILYGANCFKIAHAIGSASRIIIAKNVSNALKIVANQVKSGESVIFSPASASFDMFSNSKERGKLFTKLVRSIR